MATKAFERVATRIRSGLDLRFAGAPRQSIVDSSPAGKIAVLGVDYPDMRFDVLVEPGAQVVAGEPLLRDRKHPNRLVVAPVSGRIDAITRGARRSIGSVEISPEGSAAHRFDVPAALDGAVLRSLLLESGLWVAIRARPFGHPADLAHSPEALFITAMDTRPHAPDPAVVIAEHAGWFRRGAEALTLLTSGRTYLCHASGIKIGTPGGVTPAAFSGRHPAGLASTHIHHLHPIGRSAGVVWQIGYQDVIALGHLLETGQVWADRIVAVSGPGVLSPALLRTRPGADLRQLLQGRLTTDAVNLYSGSRLDGRVQAFLSREHLQVFAAPHHNPVARGSGFRHVLHNWVRAGVPAVIPNAVHEKAAPIGILPIPLLRALSVGDVDAARQLGALALVEEDLALLSYVDGSATDFSVLLRSVLNEIEGAG